MEPLPGVTHYSIATRAYFEANLRVSMELAAPQDREGKVLDFGCGYGRLAKLFPDREIVGFDVIPELSEVDDWKAVDASVVVANHVLYCLDDEELSEFATHWRSRHVPVVFSDSLARRRNRALAAILGRSGSLDRLRRTPDETLQFLSPDFELKVAKRVWGLSGVFRLEPKTAV